MPEIPQLTDGVVTLNAFTLADLHDHVAGEDDEHAQRFGWYPARSTEETARAAFARWEHDWRSDGPTRVFAVRAAASDVLVGGCQIRRREKRIGEISYWTSAPHRRRGYATGAVLLVSAFAFEQLGIERLEAYVEPDNLASRRVVERAGFVMEGVVRRRELTASGERRDMVLYSLLPSDRRQAE